MTKKNTVKNIIEENKAKTETAEAEDDDDPFETNKRGPKVAPLGGLSDDEDKPDDGTIKLRKRKSHAVGLRGQDRKLDLMSYNKHDDDTNKSLKL